MSVAINYVKSDNFLCHSKAAVALAWYFHEALHQNFYNHDLLELLGPSLRISLLLHLFVFIFYLNDDDDNNNDDDGEDVNDDDNDDKSGVYQRERDR